MSRAGLLTLLTLLVMAVAGTGLWLRFGRSAPAPPDRVVQAQRGDIVEGVLAVGRVEPRTRVEVKCKANGLIQKFHVDVNDAVRAGEVIVELDKEILLARVEEAEGKLEQARASLRLAEAELDRIEVERKNPELEFARKNWERVEKLHKEGVASIEELDAAHERLQKAQYELTLLDAREKHARASLAAADGKVKEVQALTDLARQELQEATIVSPIDGVVLYRYLEEGDAVSSIRSAGGNATVIMTLGDLSELYVDGEVDEVDVGKIVAQQRVRPDLIARVTVESFKGTTFLGRVARITPLGLEDQNGIVTFEVRIILENPEKLLLANMTANSLIVLREKKDVMLLSQGALLTEGKERFALVWDPATGGGKRRAVEIGLSDGSQVEITGGLSPEEKVILP